MQCENTLNTENRSGVARQQHPNARASQRSHRAEDPNVNISPCQIKDVFGPERCQSTFSTVERAFCENTQTSAGEKQGRRLIPAGKPRGRSFLHTIKKGVNVRSPATLRVTVKSTDVLYIAEM